MYVHYTRKFKRLYKKLSRTVQEKADEKVMLFVANPFHPLLHNHPLGGEYQGCRSINVTGDFRIVYRERGTGVISLEAIGTHHELYGS